MYGEGADIIFQVAGTTGMGVLKAAQESGKYAIGIDSDQVLTIEENNPEQAGHILTSMMKNVDRSIYRALKLYIDGRLPFGHAETLGIKDGGVGVSRNKYYEEATPVDVKAKINQTEMDIVDGKIKIDTAFKWDGQIEMLWCYRTLHGYLLFDLSDDRGKDLVANSSLQAGVEVTTFLSNTAHKG